MPVRTFEWRIRAGKFSLRRYRVVALGNSTGFPSLRGAYAAARKLDVRTPNTGLHVVEVATGKVVWGAAHDGHIPSSELVGTGGPAAE